MAFMSSLPPNRNNGFRCPYCGKDGFKYEKAQTKRGWALFDPRIDGYHDLDSCQSKNDSFAIENKREQPKVYFAKAISYWKFPHSSEPIKQEGVIKKLCSCTKEQIYPCCLIDYKYFFNTYQITKVIWTYWCGQCGLEMTGDQVRYWFSDHDFVKLQQENRIKSTWS